MRTATDVAVREEWLLSGDDFDEESGRPVLQVRVDPRRLRFGSAELGRGETTGQTILSSAVSFGENEIGEHNAPQIPHRSFRYRHGRSERPLLFLAQFCK